MEAKDVLAISIQAAAFAIGAVTLIKAFLEFRLQGTMKRAETFLMLRSRLREDEVFSRICNLLETDSEELQSIPLVDRDRFIGFFEELALLYNSRLINDQVVLYMFGYFAVRCFQSRNFWRDLNRNQPLWSLFMTFSERLETMERQFEFVERNFRL